MADIPFVGRSFAVGPACASVQDLASLRSFLAPPISAWTPQAYVTSLKDAGFKIPEPAVLQQDIDRLALAPDEILDTYTSCIKIHSHAESRPIIPLFKAARKPVPPEVKVDHEQMGYDFYLVEITSSMHLAQDQFPLSAALGLTISDDIKKIMKRSRVYRLFPERKDSTLFSFNIEGGVGIDANMNFSIPMSGSDIIPFGKLDTKAKLKAGFVFGPVSFQFRKAAIQVTGTGDQEVLWYYSNFDPPLYGISELTSVLVLKIHEKATSVQLNVFLAVKPCKRTWILLKDSLPPLSAKATLPVELGVRKKYSKKIS